MEQSKSANGVSKCFNTWINTCLHISDLARIVDVCKELQRKVLGDADRTSLALYQSLRYRARGVPGKWGDLGAFLGTSSMFALGMACRLVGAAWYIRAACPGCGAYPRLFRLPCGCSTCGCETTRCPNCGMRHHALSDIRTLSSDEDPSTTVSASSEHYSQKDEHFSSCLPIASRRQSQAAGVAERLLDFAVILYSVDETKVPDVARDAIKCLHTLVPADTSTAAQSESLSTQDKTPTFCHDAKTQQTSRKKDLFVVRKGCASLESKVNLRCFLCDKKFTASPFLASHEEQTHQHSFGCGTCRKRFRCSRDLRRHSRATQHGISVSFRLDSETEASGPIVELASFRWRHNATGRVLREVYAQMVSEAELGNLQFAAEVLARYRNPADDREYLWCPATNEFFYASDALAMGWEMLYK